MLDCKISAGRVRLLVNGQLPNNPQQPSPERVKRVEVYWHAVSYKQLVTFVLLFIAVIFGALYFVTPGFYAAVLKKVSSAVSGGGSGLVAQASAPPEVA